MGTSAIRRLFFLRLWAVFLFGVTLASAEEKTKNFYEILGVAQDATQDDIKKAYRILAKEYHPDKHTDKPEEEIRRYESMFKELGQAYETLSDLSKKRNYDMSLRGGSSARYEPIDPDEFLSIPEQLLKQKKTDANAYEVALYKEYRPSFRSEGALLRLLASHKINITEKLQLLSDIEGVYQKNGQAFNTEEFLLKSSVENAENMRSFDSKYSSPDKYYHRDALFSALDMLGLVPSPKVAKHFLEIESALSLMGAKRENHTAKHLAGLVRERRKEMEQGTPSTKMGLMGKIGTKCRIFLRDFIKF